MLRSYHLCGGPPETGQIRCFIECAPFSTSQSALYSVEMRQSCLPAFLRPPGHEAAEPHMCFPDTHILLLGANYLYPVLLRALDLFRNICFIARQHACLGAESRRGLAALSLRCASFRLYPERFSCKSALHLVSFPSKPSENSHSTAAFSLVH